jgi:hypothetical protein
VTVPDITANAVFRLTGPGGVVSPPVLVVVVPPVSASLSPGPQGDANVVTASSPLASPGDLVVLQVWLGSRWRDVQAGQLNSAGQAVFPLRAQPRQHTFRMELLPTAAHGLSVSNTVTVPPR